MVTGYKKPLVSASLLLLYATTCIGQNDSYVPTLEDTFCEGNRLLAKSKHDSISSYSAALDLTLDLDCYLYCDDEYTEFYYDKELMTDINNTALAVSIIGLIFSITLMINVCVAHFQSKDNKFGNNNTGGNGNLRRQTTSTRNQEREKSKTATHTDSQSGPNGSNKKAGERAGSPRYNARLKRSRTLTNQFKDNFKDRPFTYDVPFCVNVGYMLAILSIMSPYFFGRENVICNTDEATVTRKNPGRGNGVCTFVSIMLLFAIHIIGLYQAALAFSLFRRLKNPTSAKGVKITRQKIHLCLWLLIIMVVIAVPSFDVIGGDFVLGICTSGLANKDSLLWLNVVPIGVYWVTGLGFLLGSIVLLRKHLQYTKSNSKNKSQNAKMRRFFIRFITYGGFSTFGTAMYWISMVVFYANFDDFQDSARQWIGCELELIGFRVEAQALGYTEEQAEAAFPDKCHKERGNPPSPVLYLLLPITAALVTMAGLILSCTDDNFLFWKGLFQDSAKRTVDRMVSFRKGESSANLSEHDSMQHKDLHATTTPSNNAEIVINDGSKKRKTGSSPGGSSVGHVTQIMVPVPERSPAVGDTTPVSPDSVASDVFAKDASKKGSKMSIMSLTSTDTATATETKSVEIPKTIPQTEMVATQSDYLSSDEDAK